MSEQPESYGGPPPAPEWTPPPGPSGPRAGFGRRLSAWLIDIVVLALVGYVVGRILGDDVVTVTDGTFNYELTGTPFLITDLIALAYYTIFEGAGSGQTIGKRLRGIRVVDFSTGGPIGYGRAFVRGIGRAVSFIVLLLGYLWMLWDDQKQTWHDKFANAIVVPTEAYPIR